MIIKKITKLKNGKYKINIDDEIITTYDEIILKDNLLYNKNISNEKLDKILKETELYDVYNKIIHMISIKYRSIFEIEKYLDNKVNELNKNILINKLIDNNLLNDERYTEAYINDKINLTKDGPLLIKRNLINNNIDINIINKYIDQIDNEKIYNKLQKQIINKIKSNKNSKSVLYNKILITYSEKGYDINMIKEIFNNNYLDNNDNYIIEYNKIKSKLEKKYSGHELENKVKQKLYQKGYR